MPTLLDLCCCCGASFSGEELYKEWDKHPAVQQYSFVKRLGEGGFSEVQLAQDKLTGKAVALKIIFLNRPGLTAEQRKILAGEAKLIRMVAHPQIVRCMQVLETRRQQVLVLEHLSGGEMLQQLQRVKRYTEAHACQLFRQVVDAMAYLHSLGIMHRDIKPENCLLAKPVQHYAAKAKPVKVKVIDLGMAGLFRPARPLYGCMGSPGFIAPEVVLGDAHTPAMDVYSLGVLLFVMLVGRKPWDSQRSHTLQYAVYSSAEAPGLADPSFLALSGTVRQLLLQMLAELPEARPSAAAVLAHPWMRQGAQGAAPERLIQPAVQQRLRVLGNSRQALERGMSVPNPEVGLLLSDGYNTQYMAHRADRAVSMSPGALALLDADDRLCLLAAGTSADEDSAGWGPFSWGGRRGAADMAASFKQRYPARPIMRSIVQLGQSLSSSLGRSLRHSAAGLGLSSSLRSPGRHTFAAAADLSMHAHTVGFERCPSARRSQTDDGSSAASPGVQHLLSRASTATRCLSGALHDVPELIEGDSGTAAGAAAELAGIAEGSGTHGRDSSTVGAPGDMVLQGPPVGRVASAAAEGTAVAGVSDGGTSKPAVPGNNRAGLSRRFASAAEQAAAEQRARAAAQQRGIAADGGVGVPVTAQGPGSSEEGHSLLSDAGSAQQTATPSMDGEYLAFLGTALMRAAATAAAARDEEEGLGLPNGLCLPLQQALSVDTTPGAASALIPALSASSSALQSPQQSGPGGIGSLTDVQFMLQQDGEAAGDSTAGTTIRAASDAAGEVPAGRQAAAAADAEDGRERSDSAAAAGGLLRASRHKRDVSMFDWLEDGPLQPGSGLSMTDWLRPDLPALGLAGDVDAAGADAGEGQPAADPAAAGLGADGDAAVADGAAPGAALDADALAADGQMDSCSMPAVDEAASAAGRGSLELLSGDFYVGSYLDGRGLEQQLGLTGGRLGSAGEEALEDEDDAGGDGALQQRRRSAGPQPNDAAQPPQSGDDEGGGDGVLMLLDEQDGGDAAASMARLSSASDGDWQQQLVRPEGAAAGPHLGEHGTRAGPGATAGKGLHETASSRRAVGGQALVPLVYQSQPAAGAAAAAAAAGSRPKKAAAPHSAGGHGWQSSAAAKAAAARAAAAFDDFDEPTAYFYAS
ncbi:hypothetical protein OEZ86_002200 [Tetradesmus obliquus]|nr:hypothetical protein OEZ86_002200 [Tetradesmus obliquus]